VAAGRHRAPRHRFVRKGQSRRLWLAAAAGVAALVAGDAAAGSWPSEEVLATDSAAEPKVRTAPEIDHRARTADQPTRFTERPPIQAVAPSAGTAVADPIPTERRFLTEDLNL